MHYYVNKTRDIHGDHEVHKHGCHKLPSPSNRISLGVHATCKSAVAAAKKHYTKTNGCIHCSKSCHTS